MCGEEGKGCGCCGADETETKEESLDVPAEKSGCCGCSADETEEAEDESEDKEEKE